MHENDVQYRCNKTIDLEEAIKMKKDVYDKHGTATVKYKSGREEVSPVLINQNGLIHKASDKKMRAFRNFPTVESVTINKQKAE